MKLRSSQPARGETRPRGPFPLLCIILAFSALAFAQTEKMRLGPTFFFGYEGLDVSQIRAALPVHEGEEFSHQSWDEAKQRCDKPLNE